MALCRKLCAAGKIPRTRWAPTWSVTASASSERTKACKYISRQRMTDANALLKQVPANIPLGQTSPSLRFSSWAVNLPQEWLSKLEACLQQLQPTTSNEDWWQSNEVGWCIMDVFCWKNCDLANRIRWCCLLESLQCSDVKCRMPRPSLMRLRHDDTGDFGRYCPMWTCDLLEKRNTKLDVNWKESRGLCIANTSRENMSQVYDKRFEVICSAAMIIMFYPMLCAGLHQCFADAARFRSGQEHRVYPLGIEGHWGKWVLIQEMHPHSANGFAQKDDIFSRKKNEDWTWITWFDMF